MRKQIVTNQLSKFFDLDYVVSRNEKTGKVVTTDDKLRTFYGRVVKGNSQIYDTPFAKGESTHQLLKAWMNILKSIDRKWPSLWEYELDLAAKVGPMSITLPLKQRMDSINEYYKGILLPSRPIEKWAQLDVLSEWQKARGLRPRSQEQTVAKMKKSTSSGAPFDAKRRNVVDLSHVSRVQWFSGKDWPCYLETNGYSFFPVAMLGWRGQEGGPEPDDVKQRVVWMFPFSANILELEVYQPLIEAAQKFDLVPSWVSMEQVDYHVTQLFDTKGDDDLIVCTDFSKFDQHFNRSLQDAAAEVLDGLFHGSRGFGQWLETIYRIKYTIPMMYNYGKLMTGEHGMASGSGGTNADETLAHRSLQYEVAGLHDATLNPHSMCLGDDGVLSYPGITVNDVIAAYSTHGLEMNEGKQYAATNECIYLRRWHHKEYRINGICAGVYSTCRALGRLRYLEKFYDPDVWSAEAVALRQLSILENCKYHPLKEEFVQFCMKRDKYRLGIDIPDFLENIEVKAQEIIDLIPDFLGYTKSLQAGGNPVKGISQWWVVKYLKSV